MHFNVYCVILGFKEVGISFMLKGAICFFAFSIFLFGCTTKMAHPPLPLPPSHPPIALPDLTLPDISLSEEEGEVIERFEVSPDVDEKEKMVERKESSDDFAKDYCSINIANLFALLMHNIFHYK